MSLRQSRKNRQQYQGARFREHEKTESRDALILVMFLIYSQWLVQLTCRIGGQSVCQKSWEKCSHASVSTYVGVVNRANVPIVYVVISSVT